MVTAIPPTWLMPPLVMVPVVVPPPFLPPSPPPPLFCTAAQRGGGKVRTGMWQGSRRAGGWGSPAQCSQPGSFGFVPTPRSAATWTTTLVLEAVWTVLVWMLVFWFEFWFTVGRGCRGVSAC